MQGDQMSAVSAMFEQNIGSGAWRPGMKLPTERELERQFGVPRNKLRKILKELEASGKITRHVGRGSFVAESEGRSTPHPYAPILTPIAPSRFAANAPDVLSEANLIERIQGASPADIMEIRIMIEPPAAELAAARAGQTDLLKIQDAHERSKLATDVPEFEYWDGQLHLAIILACKNELLSGIYEAVNGARLQPQWEKMKQRSATPTRRESYKDQHGELVEALFERDAKRARQISLDHLLIIRRNFFGD